jgi:hypothetical protein
MLSLRNTNTHERVRARARAHTHTHTHTHTHHESRTTSVKGTCWESNPCHVAHTMLPVVYSVTECADFSTLHFGFLNVTKFHGTRVNVISFTPTPNLRPSLRQVLQNPLILISIMCIFLLANFTRMGYRLTLHLRP